MVRVWKLQCEPGCSKSMICCHSMKSLESNHSHTFSGHGPISSCLVLCFCAKVISDLSVSRDVVSGRLLLENGLPRIIIVHIQRSKTDQDGCG